MPKTVELKTSKNTNSVSDYINTVEPKRQADAKLLIALFKDATDTQPKMWGPSIIGFGEYTYYRSNGAEGTFMATGFSIRKSGPVLYIMPGYADYTDLLKQLGSHRLGKSCLYLKNLEEVDTDVLVQIIRKGLVDLQKTHEVTL